MKDPCAFTAAEILPLLKLEFQQRGIPEPDFETLQKLSLIAKMGIVQDSHGHLVPSSGTIEVAAATTAAMFIHNTNPNLGKLLYLTVDQLRQREKQLCPGGIIG